MPRTFLPLPAPGQGYPLPQNLSHEFVGGPNSLLEDIHEKMAASVANSEGRAPSPFARVWQFRRDLAGGSGPQEKARAVAAFRGLLALFALREYYHVLISADVTPSLTKDSKGQPTALSRFFEVHTSYLPEPGGAARARFLFGQRLVYFRLTEPLGTPGTVVAGYSPLTLIYPAARRLNHSRALNAIFWYDPEAGRWHDPLHPPGRLPPRLSQDACAYLAAWLDGVLAIDAANDQQLAILARDGLAVADDKFVAQLLREWREELTHLSTVPVGRARSIPLVKSADLQNIERTQGSTFHVPELLEMAYDGVALPSDSVARAGTLILTLAQARNPAHLIYGNVFGSEAIAATLAGKPAEGDDLGKALERPGEAPVSYVILDKLFTPRLGRLRQGASMVNKLWTALTLADAGAPTLNGVFSIPFDPAVLRYFSAQEIKQGLKAENNIAAIQVTFQHEATGLEISRNYHFDTSPGQSQIVPLDPSLDLRFFPDFRLDLLANKDLQLPFPEDRYYYARLRLSSTLDVLPMQWLAADGSPIAEAPEFMGDFERPDQKSLAPGRQAFWRLPIETTPGAFHIAGYGLLLLTLRGSSQAAATPADALSSETASTAGDPVERRNTARQPGAWTVALDFGTTNSCVAVDMGTENVDAAYRLPVFTTTFFAKWETALRGESDEGFSALADFMFWQNGETNVLNQNEFFPTQILTKHPLSLEELPYPGGFDERNGLAFFPNVSLVAVDLEEFPDLLKGFEGMRTDSGIQARFNLKRNLKWKEPGRDGDRSFVWRTVFHQHLRLHLIMAAANENAYIKRLIASYPKAFIPEAVRKYGKDLAKIWGSADADLPDAATRRSGTTIELLSESAAAAVALGVTPGQEFFLLDMGGGTTDVAVFKDNVLEGECSLTLAGQVLERYVCRSANLRKQIAKHFDGPMKKWQKAFVQSGRFEQMYQTLFQGFLVRSKGAQELTEIRSEGKTDPSTQGFFLSAVFLYTGLAYFCGLWLAKRRQGGKGITPEERLQWLGNGSAFIQMLSGGDRSFEDVLVRMFNTPCQGVARVSTMRKDGKTVVAKGLLKPPAVESPAGGQKVFSSLLTDSVTSMDHRWSEADTLGDFYRQFTGAEVFWDGLSDGKVFRGYLEALQKELPMLKFNQSLLVSVDALGIRDTQNWAVEYVTQHRDALQTKLVERLKVNKREWDGELRTGSSDALYVEPLFVSELAALLEQVYESYA